MLKRKVHETRVADQRVNITATKVSKGGIRVCRIANRLRKQQGARDRGKFARERERERGGRRKKRKKKGGKKEEPAEEVQGRRG